MAANAKHTQTRTLATSWDANAELWTRAVRENAIASRRAGTDAAILDAIMERKPGRVLDVGCGEGWLVRALRGACDCDVVGIDAVPALIAAAREADPDNRAYYLANFDHLIADPALAGRDFDVAVFNYALLDEALQPVLSAVREVLTPGGAVIIQTVHPREACNDAPYVDGWRTETFDGFGGGAWAAMPWYFRTGQSWLSEIAAAGLRVGEIREPVAEEGGAPLSLLMICTLAKMAESDVSLEPIRF